MKLPSFKRLIKSDYKPEFQALIELLSFSINNGIEVLYQALNRSVSLKDNIACTVKDVIIEVDSSGVPKSRTSFGLDTSGRVIGVVVLNAVASKNPLLTPTSGVFVSFSQENRTVTINSVVGLPSDQQFTLTLVAFDS